MSTAPSGIENWDQVWSNIGPVVERIVKRSASRHAFAYYSEEDIAQEIRLIALNAYRSYKPELGALENYLAKSVVNRLSNLRRDRRYSLPRPCQQFRCELAQPNGGCELPDRNMCVNWRQYESAYARGVGILNPASLYDDYALNLPSDVDIQVFLNDFIEYAQRRGVVDIWGLPDSQLRLLVSGYLHG